MCYNAEAGHMIQTQDHPHISTCHIIYTGKQQTGFAFGLLIIPRNKLIT